MEKRYQIPFENGKLELVAGYFKTKIYLDNVLIPHKATRSINPKFDFQIRGIAYQLQINIALNGNFVVTLLKGGVNIFAGEYSPFKSGDPISVGSSAKEIDKKFPILPIWGWICIIACGIIPVLTLGGAVPAAIGFAGAYGCFHVARMEKPSVAIRIMMSIGIVGLTWIIFLVTMALLQPVINNIRAH